jgi:TPR repeat protein
VELWIDAAYMGNVTAQCDLGSAYLSGEGVPKDGAKALELFTEAAEQGDAKSHYKLGVMYMNPIIRTYYFQYEATRKTVQPLHASVYDGRA